MKLPDKFRYVLSICERVAAGGGIAYLVGGCVRDLLLGRSPLDLDMEVFGMTPSQLESLFGSSLEFVGKHYGIYRLKNMALDIGLPRREVKIGERHRDFSVETLPQMTVREAASRRDFTINSIYWDPLQDVFRDPFSGRKDLRAKVLRHVSRRFSEDPLRVLRGMQFVSRFDLTVDDRTVELCRRLSPNYISGERIFEEFAKLILMGTQIGCGLQFLQQVGWLSYLPELEALERCQQDPVYHPEGSVFNHICCAMDSFARLRPDGREDGLVVGFAVLCHDFGKPKCTRWNQVGRLCSVGHEVAGVEPSRRFLRRLRAPKSLIQQILPLVEYHMLPRKFDERSPDSNSFVKKLAALVGRLDRLILVTKADAAGRPPLPANWENEEGLFRRAESLGLLRKKPDPILKGRDLQEVFHLTPSPRFRAILKQIYEAQLEEKFLDREGALSFAEAVIHEVSCS